MTLCSPYSQDGHILHTTEHEVPSEDPAQASRKWMASPSRDRRIVTFNGAQVDHGLVQLE